MRERGGGRILCNHKDSAFGDLAGGRREGEQLDDAPEVGLADVVDLQLLFLPHLVDDEVIVVGSLTLQPRRVLISSLNSPSATSS